MAESILTTTKRTLGLAEDYVVFDQEVIMHINSALGTLTQLGIGPESGFMIVDETDTWEDFMGTDPRFNPAKSYVYLRVRLLFDPPGVGYVLTAWEKQKEELEWRLNVQREDIAYPMPPPDQDSSEFDEVVIDGGLP